MQSVRQFTFYDLGAKLNRVAASRQATQAADLFVPLMEAQTALDALLKGDPIALDYAVSEGKALLARLGSLFDKHFIDRATRQFRYPAPGESIDAHELSLVRALVEKFETALAIELSRHAIYAVPKRGLYETAALAEHAERQFPAAVLAALTNSQRADVRAAGRALAFGLGAAACFHLTRAVDAALQRYLEIYTGAAADKFVNPWKDGLGKLAMLSREKGGPDARAVTMLQDVDFRYRQALNDPAVTLSLDEAATYFGLGGALLTLMTEDGLRKQNALSELEAIGQEFAQDDEDDGGTPRSRSS